MGIVGGLLSYAWSNVLYAMSFSTTSSSCLSAFISLTPLTRILEVNDQ